MMKRLFLPFLCCAFFACGTTARKVASDSVSQIDAGPELTLKDALASGSKGTVAFLKETLQAQAPACAKGHSPRECFESDVWRKKAAPASIAKADSTAPSIHQFIRKHKNSNLTQRLERSSGWSEKLACSDAAEAYAVALTLERDFPDSRAISRASDLYAKVGTCADSEFKTDSLLHASIIAISQSDCPSAQTYLASARRENDPVLEDRISYLEAKCSANSNALGSWGAYTLAWREEARLAAEKKPWALSARSGNPAWDQALAMLVHAMEDGQSNRVRWIGQNLNLEGFQALPLSFRTSFLTLFHFAEQDLVVFQVLNRVVTREPGLIQPEVLTLLYPVRFFPQIVEATNTELDPLLVKALIRQESAFDPQARSTARAYGLMQLIYPTARRYGVKSRRDLVKPEVNIRAGTRFLKSLIKEFGSIELALAAYNAGPLKVREWQARYPVRDMDLFVEFIPYRETREYVRLVLRNYRAYQVLNPPSTRPPNLAQH